MKKMRRMAALLLSCVLIAACSGIGSRAEEDTRGDFVFGDYVGDVDPHPALMPGWACVSV